MPIGKATIEGKIPAAIQRLREGAYIITRWGTYPQHYRYTKGRGAAVSGWVVRAMLDKGLIEELAHRPPVYWQDLAGPREAYTYYGLTEERC